MISALGVLGEGLAELTATPGEDAVALGFGGDAANVAVMAARAGAVARLCGRVGDDALGRALRRFWVEEGVDDAAVRTDPAAATGLYLNEDDPDGRHRFVYWRQGSAGSRLAPADVTDVFADGLGILAVTGVTLSISASARRAAAEAARRARATGGRVAFVVNHRPALRPDATVLGDFAAGADIVIGSREDYTAIFGADDPKALRAALRGGPREIVASDEDRPALLLAGGVAHPQPVPPARVVNAAGAGDALAGAYLAARLAGQSPRASLRQGVTAASLSVARAGCARSYPTAAALAAALRPETAEASR